MLELPRLQGAGASAGMIESAVRRAEEGLAAVELEGALDRERVKKMLIKLKTLQLQLQQELILNNLAHKKRKPH